MGVRPRVRRVVLLVWELCPWFFAWSQFASALAGEAARASMAIAARESFVGFIVSVRWGAVHRVKGVGPPLVPQDKQNFAGRVAHSSECGGSGCPCVADSRFSAADYQRRRLVGAAESALARVPADTRVSPGEPAMSNHPGSGDGQASEK